jgi:hypothetical protein
MAKLVIATGLGCKPPIKGAMGSIKFVIVTGFGSCSNNCAPMLVSTVMRGVDGIPVYWYTGTVDRVKKLIMQQVVRKLPGMTDPPSV